MKICSRDWQDFLTKLERIATAMEVVASSVATPETIARFAEIQKRLKTSEQALSAATATAA